MTQRMIFEEADGTQRVLYELGAERQKDLPSRLVIHTPATWELLDKLMKNSGISPMVVDSVMRTALESLFRPHDHFAREVAVRNAIERLYEEALAAIPLDSSPRTPLHIEMTLRMAFEAFCQALSEHQLYTEGRLLYDYEKRRGHHATLLRRKQFFTFDP